MTREVHVHELVSEGRAEPPAAADVGDDAVAQLKADGFVHHDDRAHVTSSPEPGDDESGSGWRVRAGGEHRFPP